MKIQYDVEKLNQMIADFYQITGISINLLDREYRGVTEQVLVKKTFCRLLQGTWNHKCMEYDKKILEECAKTRKPVIHVCYAGLLDAALPVIVKGEIVGYIIMGQVRQVEDFSVIEENLPVALLPKLQKSYTKLPLYTLEQMESATRIVGAMITQIIEEKMILITSEELATLAGEYIEKNLGEPLSVEELCRIFSVSKNRLYQCFHRYYETTVNGYIVDRRMEKAKELLKKTNDSVDVIAEQVGFRDSAYFFKVFKKNTGKTPIGYRKESA